MDVVWCAWVSDRLLAVETDNTAWALAVEAVHLINTSAAGASSVSLESALVNVDSTSFTTEALLAAASQQILLVDDTHTIVETVSVWTFRWLVALRYAVVEILVEVCAY